MAGPIHRRVARASLVGVVVTGLAVPWVAPALANDDGVLVGRFEIDGNYYEGLGNDSTADNAIDPIGIDWGTVEGDYDHIVDPLQPDDETVFSGGSSENDPVDDWSDDSSAQLGGSADINNVYLYDEIFPTPGGDQFVYLAWDRETDQGTVGWFVELNQLPNETNPNGTSVPQRSVGDIRVVLVNQGGGPIEIDSIDQWDGDSWEDAPAAEIVGDSNDSTINVPGGQLTTELFNEFGFNLTDIFGEDEDCTFTGFSQLNLRSAASSQQNSALKDYATGPIDIPARCGALTIEKQDPDGELIGGAGFTIEPNPIPGAGDPDSLDITDNDGNDGDPDDGVIAIDPAEPGDYTITEATPPPGYIPTTEPQNVTIEEFGSATVVFENRLGTLTWSKVDDETGDPVCCATFEVTGTEGEADGTSITVVDNGTNDTNPADGVITVEDLVTGTYTVTETVPPAGYDLPDDPTREGVVIDADNPDVTIGVDFSDPRLLSELSVLKLDAETGDELAGATFELYLDDGDGVPDAPDGDDTLIDGCVTAGDGTCTIGDLDWGTYYWFEVEAPTGYELPADRNSAMIVIDRDNAGGEFEAAQFEDPQALTDLSVQKLDQVSEEPLEGATFELYLDDGDGVPDAPDGDDILIDDCTTGGDGTCTVTDLPFGDYYWFETVAPPGYDLPDDPYSVIITINAANAGTEIEPISFFDPRRPGMLTVLKVDDTDDESLAEAVFDLVLDDGDGVYEADEDTVVGTCVTNETGTCSVGDLDFGTYFWVETAAPTGYELPDEPVSEPIVIDADNVDDEPTPVEFRDPRLLSELSVLKLDEVDETPLAGATFELYLDDGDGVGDAPDNGDVLIDECTTGEDGTCTIGDLGFGDYYWYETEAPDGYVIPDDATSDIITITVANAGTAMEPVIFHDPPVDEPTPTPTPTPPIKPPQPDLPATGLSVSPWTLGLAAAVLITAGGCLLLAAKRNRVRGSGLHIG